MRHRGNRIQSRSKIGATGLMAAGALLLLIAAVFNLAPAPVDSRVGAAAQTELHNHRGRPTHMYEGTCADLGEVKHSLNPVGAGEMSGSDMSDVPGMAIGTLVGAPEAMALEIGSIALAVPIDEIVGDQLAVAVQRSEGEYGVWVACGEVGGAMTADGLAFGIRELNGSGLSGIAVLAPGDGETRVTVYLGLIPVPAAAASPAAAGNQPDA